MAKIFKTVDTIILASASPRRRMLLDAIGVTCVVQPADIDESLMADETPQSYTKRMARQKSAAVGAVNPEQWILAADTCVVAGGDILGKPASFSQAVAMLGRLSGRTHQVYSGVSLLHKQRGIQALLTVHSEVSFAAVSQEVLKAYAATDEPYDKAGAYGIQGIGAMLVESVNGSYTNIVGLPLAEVVALLLSHSIIAVRSVPPLHAGDTAIKIHRDTD
ncbi:MAG: septum formation protein Maf [Desulfofustis sp. PB-SRB1]|jgi:septum formation protein|nr:septum formation protein Maf [Desulfofustis sp. PB-SRB1]MBM1002907.1 septum formation protein Maf [Desulfofustis sp. PB-SRB1]HBH29791.1 septum formation protein Maf [Desulfofustis sp.]HBH32728.1 septum formation protein Maf [Desulfofustis sp.]